MSVEHGHQHVRRRRERRGRRQVQRHVEVHAPRALGGQRVERLREVVGGEHDSIGPELAGLVEVARLAEARDRGAADRVGRLLHVERRRGLHLHDPQAGIGDPAQRGRRIGERHREVAGVEADADELGIDQARARARGEPSDHVVDGVEHAARLGFDGEPHGAAGLVAERAQLARHERQGLGRRPVVLLGPRLAPGERERRDAAGPPSGRRSASTLAQSRVWATRRASVQSGR